MGAEAENAPGSFPSARLRPHGPRPHGPVRSAEHAAARRRLLAPLDRQQEAIRACLRARRRVTDVDPRTGEEVSEVPPAETPAVPAHDGPAPGTTAPTE